MGSAIEQEHFESAEDFLDALVRRNLRWAGPARAWIFRGQADDAWPLVPSAMRPGAKFPGADYGVQEFPPAEVWKEFMPRIIAELQVVGAFVEALDSGGLAVPGEGPSLRALFDRHVDGGRNSAPNLVTKTTRGDRPWPPEELLPLFALAQHYGLPTRLLDWSYSAMVAAYFAAKGAASSERSTQIGVLVVWGMDQREVSTLTDRQAPWNAEKREDAIRIVHAPAQPNPNLTAQKGVFTVDRRVAPNEDSTWGKQPLDQVIEEAASRFRGEVRTVMRRHTLPWSEARKLLRLLADEGINAGQLFPGHEGAAEACREKLLWDEVKALTSRVSPREP